MKIVIITRPDFFEGETTLVNSMFVHGMERLHLRKPRATINELTEWIEGIAPSFRQRIVVHDHHSLAKDYDLGGIHLNSRNSVIPVWAEQVKSERTFTISRSCHSIVEVQQYKCKFDYVFLSPVYDSISKEGYGSAFSRQQLSDAYENGVLDNKVYALGGVSAEKLQELKDMGFHGAAVLGDIWMAQSPCDRMLMYNTDSLTNERSVNCNTNSLQQ